MSDTHTESAGPAESLLHDSGAIDRLAALAEALAPRRQAVVHLWARLYAQALGDDAFFPAAEFHACFGQELEALLAALRARDPGRVAALLRRRGQELAAMGVPFSELVASLHLFEDSCLAHLDPADPAASLVQHRTLDRLSHVRIALLAEAYLAEREEEEAERAAALERDLGRLYRDSVGRDALGGLIGWSLPMQVLYRRIEVAARSEAPVLLVGESGTGKELAAHAVHALSPRAQAPFVPVNCAALPSSLVESELFGHRKGAFTGADADTAGLLRHAHGGTLFLDEITEMPAEAQAKLLRAIQDKAVRPVGELREVPTDFRIVTSTNRPPDAAVRAGRLRADLLYRLRAILVELPPLRSRLQDLELLAGALLSRARLGQVTLDPDALEALKRRPWPGNVRELEATLLAAAAAAPRGRIRVVDLPRPAAHAATEVGASPRSAALPTLRDAEHALLRRALAETGGNKREAAKRLGVSRKWLYARLAEME